MVTIGIAPIKEEFLLPKSDYEDESNNKDKRACKKRKRGQNKKREKPFSVKKQSMVCQYIVREEECLFKEKCQKIHDIKKYMQIKDPDLGDKCVLFESFGKCCYGVACRFASSHLDENYKNIINEEKMEKMKIYEVQPTLKRDFQMKLRSRDVIFSKSDKYFIDNNIDYVNEIDAKKNKKAATAQSNARRIARKINTAGTSHHQNNDSKESLCVNQNSELITTENDIERSIVEDIQQKTDCDDCYPLKSREKKTIDFNNKLFLAPLTTVGNLPFRRVCKEFGADITCGEMAMCDQLLQGQMSEWALLKRHHSEDIFGVQICGSSVVKVTKTCEVINSECEVDFIDLNVGCPIDIVFNHGAGSALMDKPLRLVSMMQGMLEATDVPVTLKMRAGTTDKHWSAVKLCTRLKETGISLLTVHGRTRQQRYTRKADWNYISECGLAASPVPLYGNGDVLSFESYNEHKQRAGISGVMIGRGALIKPWIFKEIKEQQHWDISSSERFDMLKKYCRYGLEHWGTDTCGVEKTRHFLLEWMSFLCRYIPAGLLEVLPQRINERPPHYRGRDDLETLMISAAANDWVKLTEMLLGKVPQGFNFIPKHVANSYS